MPAYLVYHPGSSPEDASMILGLYQDMLKRETLTIQTIRQAIVYLPRNDWPLYVWALIHGEKPCGEVSLYNVNEALKVAEVGIVMARDCPKILGVRTFMRVCEFAFEDLGMERLEAWSRASNGTAVNQLKRFGFRKEGSARKALISSTGKREDAILFGLLRDEYYERWYKDGSRSPGVTLPRGDSIRSEPGKPEVRGGPEASRRADAEGAGASEADCRTGG